MTKPLHEYSDEEINTRLAFAAKLEKLATRHPQKMFQKLPDHLEQEKQELIGELLRRVQNINGDGI